MNKKILIWVTIIVIILAGFYILGNGSTTSGNVISTSGDLICEGDFCGVDSILVRDIEEISNHNTKEDCWTIVNNNVYDITNFISNHPGGEEIVKLCGVDGTSMFDNKHGKSDKAKNTLENYYIGGLE